MRPNYVLEIDAPDGDKKLYGKLASTVVDLSFASQGQRDAFKAKMKTLGDPWKVRREVTRYVDLQAADGEAHALRVARILRAKR